MGSLILDLAAKALVLREFEILEIRPVTGFFNLVLVHNKGAAFSLMSAEGSYQGLKMALLALLAMLPLAYFLVEAKTKLSLAALGLIVGGALGNIHDRLRYNAVVDFLDFHFRDYHWPAFNLADVTIVIGVGLLMWACLKQGRAQKDLAKPN
ncbi:MAG: signal peptidase II [Deltaproteobacteria bacterium]|nr:signal peptidase II [Deltaproteobacteria bacterium]